MSVLEATDAEFETWARKEHPAFWQAAYRAGALAMRERAEKAVDDAGGDHADYYMAAIRALDVDADRPPDRKPKSLQD